MELKTAQKINVICDWLTIAVIFPFGLLRRICELLMKFFDFFIDNIFRLSFKVGNKLLRMSDEAKNGTIKNQECLKHLTARQAKLNKE